MKYCFFKKWVFIISGEGTFQGGAKNFNFWSNFDPNLTPEDG